jgi:hypothetical protein
MTESATYSVVLSGNLKAGFDPDSAVEAFARLFKLSPEKAGAIVGTRAVLKREVELKVAKTYQQKLAAIGIDVQLKKHGGIELELEPVEDPGSAQAGGAGHLDSGEMICPKCQLKQAKAEECSGCGVIIQKFLQRTAESGDAADSAPAAATPGSAAAPQSAPARTAAPQTAPAEDVPLSVKWLIAPVVVAVLGALVWYLVAIKFEYEFGAIAWLIGGAVGFAAVSSGAQGHAIGAICAGLVLLSIFGGKYMTVSSQQSDFAAALASSAEFAGQDLHEFYEEEVADARDFVKLAEGDDKLREFMVSHHYSDYTEASQVSDEELAMFREYTQPRLEDIHLNRPSFEEWQQLSLVSAIEDLPTYDLMMGSLNWKDILFLAFGMISAFQLASRGRAFGS